MDRHIRVEGPAQRPAETLALRRGACRDITVLFLAACRTLGIPGRFVSGYQSRAQTPDGQRHLHAWAEAFYVLASGGRGMVTPSHCPASLGRACAPRAAPEQAATMPVEGGFYGPADGSMLTSTLDTSVRIATG